MDGMSATRAIRQYEQTYNIPRCCIIALTGLASNSARLEAWNSGIDQYMTKPVNFKKLADALGKEKARRASMEQVKTPGAAVGETQVRVDEVSVGETQIENDEKAADGTQVKDEAKAAGETQVKNEEVAAGGV